MESGAHWQRSLGRNGVREAARLAPAEQASRLAVVEAIVDSHRVALSATCTNANTRSQANAVATADVQHGVKDVERGSNIASHAYHPE